MLNILKAVLMFLQLMKYFKVEVVHNHSSHKIKKKFTLFLQNVLQKQHCSCLLAMYSITVQPHSLECG